MDMNLDDMTDTDKILALVTEGGMGYHEAVAMLVDMGELSSDHPDYIEE